MATRSGKTYEEVLGSGESLDIFIRGMAKLERRFCEAMMADEDYTLKLEMHGNAGKLIHCRVLVDGFERPRNATARTEKRHR